MNNPLDISIIIPVYNVEHYINQCLDSLHSISSNNFEVILIDDGSSDNSVHKCEYYSNIDNRFRVFKKSNGGVSSARNYGLKYARGKFVTFIDSDDWVSQDYINVITREIGNYDLLFFQSIHMYSDGMQSYFAPQVGCFDNDSSIQLALNSLLVNNLNYEFFGYTWNKVFKREIIKNNSIKFKEGLSVKEDELFTMQYCTFIKDLKIIPDAIYCYRVTQNGLTYKPKRKDDLYLLFQEEEKCTQKFNENNLISTLHRRNASFLRRALDLAVSLKDQYSMVTEYQKYITLHDLQYDFSIGRIMRIILMCNPILGVFIYRIYKSVTK